MRRWLAIGLMVVLGGGCAMDAKKRRAFVAAGSLTLAGGYAASLATGAFYYHDRSSPAYFAPLIGPIWAAVDYAQSQRSGYDYQGTYTRSDTGAEALMTLWAVPLVSAQAFGLAMLLCALLSPDAGPAGEPTAEVPTTGVQLVPAPGGGLLVLSGAL